MKKLIYSSILLLILTSCKEWLLFDMARWAIGLVLVVVVGGIGIISIIFKDKEK